MWAADWSSRVWPAGKANGRYACFCRPCVTPETPIGWRMGGCVCCFLAGSCHIKGRTCSLRRCKRWGHAMICLYALSARVPIHPSWMRCALCRASRWIAAGSRKTSWAPCSVGPTRDPAQSGSEPRGVAAIGLAAGRGIIATDVGGLAEQLSGQPNVVLCPPDPQALADAVRRMAEPGGAPRAEAIDADAAWRAMAEALLRGAR